MAIVRNSRAFWFILFGVLLAVAFEGVALAPALAGEANAANEPGGGGFDLTTAIEIVGSIAVPALTFGAGVATDRKLQQRERNREQIALADEFLASSGKVVGRLESFATGGDKADDVAPLQRELRQASEASTKITNTEIRHLGQRFFDSSVAVLRAVASPDESTQPAAKNAVQAFDNLRRGVERFRRELSPKQMWTRDVQKEIATTTPEQSPEQETSATHRETTL